MATNFLSKDDFDLIQAEGVLSFLLDETKDCQGIVATTFHEHLKKKLEDRRNSTLTFLLMYLHNSEHWNDSKHFSIPTKASIHSLGIALLKRLFSGQTEEALPDIEITQVDENISYEGKLFGRLNSSIGSLKEQPQEKTSLNFNENLKREFQYFDRNMKRTPILEKLYEALLTVQPTSTQSERNFSLAGGVVTKTRTSLGDKEVDKLCFLKSYFLNRDKM